MSITKEQIEHIANLARIRLNEKEKAKMADELASILDYIGKLNQIDTENVEPTAQVTGLENVFRKDEPTGAGPDPEKLISQFPHRKENYLKVKPVFENHG